MAEKKMGDVAKNKFVPNLPAIDDTHFPVNISQVNKHVGLTYYYMVGESRIAWKNEKRERQFQKYLFYLFLQFLIN